MSKLWLAVLFLGSTAGWASTDARQCPVLRGTYQCPADQGDPPFEMVVEQSHLGTGVVRYRWNYSDGKSVTFKAAKKPVFNADSKLYGICRKGGVYISASATDLSRSLRNELTPAGDYRVTASDQSVVMICTKK